MDDELVGPGGDVLHHNLARLHHQLLLAAQAREFATTAARGGTSPRTWGGQDEGIEDLDGDVDPESDHDPDLDTSLRPSSHVEREGCLNRDGKEVRKAEEVGEVEEVDRRWGKERIPRAVSCGSWSGHGGKRRRGVMGEMLET